jgi:orotate phosphoribosyltransferase
MLFDVHGSKKLAQKLLQIESVVLDAEQPFTWSSGLKAPIYCDNRTVLSYPDLRTYIQNQFIGIAQSLSQRPTAIAGVATAGIPHATLLADALGLPMVYVRTSAKGHGRENMIEGKLDAGHRVLLLEDLISTGGSSSKALSALREAGQQVTDLAAIFHYNFEKAEQTIQAEKVMLHALTDYNTLIEVAYQEGYIQSESIKTLQAWRADPEQWEPI